MNAFQTELGIIRNTAAAQPNRRPLPLDHAKPRFQMRIEDRIQVTQSNALDVVGLLERELSGRIVFIGRAKLLIGIARDVDAVMQRVEAAGVESDFNAAWHMLRDRLADSKIQFQRIVSGSDAPQQPCCHHA